MPSRRNGEQKESVIRGTGLAEPVGSTPRSINSNDDEAEFC